MSDDVKIVEQTETSQDSYELPDAHAANPVPRWRRHVPTAIAAALALVIGVGLGTTCGDESAAPPNAHEHEHDQAATVWTCSMHPQVQSDEPGQCPICGMDLIPVADPADEEVAAPNRVVLTERARTLAEIRTTAVRRLQDDGRGVHLLGRIERDETQVTTVTSWTAGRIERLHVATTGATIKAGQTIATLYSPEIYAAHRDLLSAQNQVEKLSEGMEFARSSAEATLESARQKLRLLGVSSAQIAKMERAEEPWTQIDIRARFGGTVMEKLVNEGAYVEAGTGIYRLADLSKLWVQLDAYESDLPRLRLGQTVRFTAAAAPDEVFEGEVTFIDAVVDPTKRTAQVRVEVANEQGRLKPGMFVDAIVEVGVGADRPQPLVIPDTAPLFSGRRSLVYVAVENAERPTYEAREVTLGPRLDGGPQTPGLYPVLAGLTEGMRVVTHGAFAIDADLQIRGGASLMSRDIGDETAAMVETSEAVRTALAPVVTRYLEVQTALAGDDLATAVQAARAMTTAADDVGAVVEAAGLPPHAARAWSDLHERIAEHAGAVAAAPTIEDARRSFEPLSATVMELLARFGNPTSETLHVAFCPMVFGNRGAEWVQTGATLENAYFGADMLTCGEMRDEIAPGAPLVRAPTAGGQR